MTFAQIIDKFDKKIISIGLIVILAILTLKISTCNIPDPLHNTNTTTVVNTSRDSSNHTVDSLTKVIKELNITLEKSVPNSVVVPEIVFVPTTKTKILVKRDTVVDTLYFNNIGNDSCRVVELNIIIPFADSTGYYVVRGYVSCLSQQAYNMQVIASGKIRLDTVIRDTNITRIHEEIIRTNSSKDSTTVITKTNNLETTVYVFANYDPLLTHNIEAMGGVSLRWKDLEAFGNIGFQAVPAGSVGSSGAKAELGIKYYLFKF